MSVPPPPPRDQLTGFPALLWSRRLHRITRQTNLDGSMRLPLFFSTSGDGRFDLPGNTGNAAAGTCYLATSEVACVVEVFGRMRLIPSATLHLYRMVTISTPEALRLADVCDPSILGWFGLTRELCTTTDYQRPHQWALALHLAGFAGIHYAPRHDPRGDLRAVALFGPAGAHDAVGAHLGLEGRQPLGDRTLRQAARYGLYVADVPPLVRRSRER